MVESLMGFETEQRSLAGKGFPVFRRGKAGPAVVVLSEVPGITPEVAGFAQRVADEGFQVYMPQMFGTPGKAASPSYMAETMGKVCISREFHVLAANRSSPIVDNLRELARQAHAECGGPGVGVVGMCLTGNFGLSMMLDAPVIAPVLSQPSLPVGPLPRQTRGLHASKTEIAAAHEKIEKDGARILGLRFQQDMLCRPGRFAALREEFGDAFEGIEIDARYARKGTGTPAHSVLTTHLIDEEGEPTRAALERTINFLREQLRATA